MHDINRKIHIISDLINHISQIVIRYFTNDRQLFCIYPDIKSNDDFVQFDKQVIQDIFAKCIETQYPILYSTELNECISGIPYFEDGRLHGIFIAGPILTSEVSYEGVWQHAGEKNLPLQYTLAFLKKYENMSVMQVDRFGALPKMIYYMLYGKTLNTTDMSLISGQINYIDILSESELTEKLSDFRINQSYCGSYQYEKKISEYIQNGDYLNLKEFISKNDPYDSHQFSIKNPLQQSKSMFVYYVSIAAHASIRGNLVPEIAYSLSEFYIQRVNEMKNVVDINTLQLKMLISYAKKVSVSEQKNASRHVVKCCEYIFKQQYTGR